MKRKEDTMSSLGCLAREVKMALCLLLLLMTVQTAMAFDYKGISYTINQDGNTVTATGLASNVSMPATLVIPDYAYDGETAYAVTVISTGAFANSQNVKKVVIGDNVTTIENAAFIDFGKSDEQHTLVLGKSVKEVNIGAFYNIAYHEKKEPKNAIYVKFDNPSTRLSLFSRAKGTTVYVKDKATYNKFAQDNYWKIFENSTKNNKLTYAFAADVTVKAGQWQTAIFSEDLSQDQLETYFGQGTKVAKLDERKYQWATPSDPYIVRFDLQDHVTGGEPILIKPAKDIWYVSNVEYGFPSAEYKPSVTMTDEEHGINVNMIGVWHDDYNLDFGQIYLRNQDGGMQFFMADNDESNPEEKSDVWVKRGKCYFEMRDADGNLLYDIPETKVEVQQNTTAIRDINRTDSTRKTAVYSLTGQYEGTTLAGRTKGIHIVNGRKVVVK